MPAVLDTLAARGVGLFLNRVRMFDSCRGHPND
jgi:hypothetical protein